MNTMLTEINDNDLDHVIRWVNVSRRASVGDVAEERSPKRREKPRSRVAHTTARDAPTGHVGCTEQGAVKPP